MPYRNDAGTWVIFVVTLGLCAQLSVLSSAGLTQDACSVTEARVWQRHTTRYVTLVTSPVRFVTGVQH